MKKCCLAQWNWIRKRKCSVIREDASQFWGFQARAEIDMQTRRIHIKTLSCFPFLPIGLDSHFDLLRLLSQSPYEQPGINEGVHSAPSRASVDSICWLYRTKDLPYHESHIRFVWGSHTSCSLYLFFFSEISSSSSSSLYHKTKRISSCRRLRADLSNGMAGCRMWSILVSHRFLSSPSIFFTTTASTHKSKKHCGIVAFR